jgi:capsular exopolysaccharide synthesis family protein
MEPHVYLRALRRRWRWVVAVLVVALTLGGTVSVTMTKRYASSVTFFVNAPSRDVADAYTGSLFSAERVKSYVEVLTSDRLARSIAEDGALGLDADQVRSRITAQAVPDSVLLQATVTDTSAARSLQIAQSLATAFINLVHTLESGPGVDTPAVNVELVTGPVLNPTPLAPRPTQVLVLAGLLGLLIGAAIAVMREVRDTSVRSPGALQQFEIGPHLGSICADRWMSYQPLIGGATGRSWRAEELRRIRTNLSSIRRDGEAHIVAVTSAVPSEGKSTTAANLAIMFAEADYRVVIVDANLRKPGLADIFRVEGAVGLTNILAGQASLDSVLQPWGAQGLWVLPSGEVPDNPSELLGSRAMAEVLLSLKEKFDVVIIDTAPLLAVTDAVVVAAQATGTILVVRQGRTAAGKVRAAVQALHSVEANVLGCVLNMTPTDQSQLRDYRRTSYRNQRPVKQTAPSQPAEPVLSPLDEATVAQLEVATTLTGQDGTDRS